MGKILAAYGGGFKPPTGGHFEIVKRALQEFPEIDEFTVFVGGKVRDGIEQEEAILVWDIYKSYLANKVNIQPSKSPIGDILRLAKNNPQDVIYFVIGYREGRQDDLDDVSARTEDLEKKYPNIVVKVIPTYDPNMSGTNARKALKKSEEEFIKFLPNEVEEKSEIYSILRPSVSEILKENSTYSKSIDLQSILIALTKHMLDMGLNISPLPSVEFIDGDTENASNFLGKTAYYDPNNNTITLFTEGRHPKDIARSFAHEMIHHIQNLEDRLGNIKTTNTNKDEDLDAIEREAYQEGNMIFRNWTDSLDGDIRSSINEAIVGEKIECDNCSWDWNIVDGGNDLFICHKCGHDNELLSENKDYFGLNKFVKEVAKEVLKEGKYDSLVTKLAGFTLNAWKGDFEDGESKGYFELEVGPGREFDYPHLFFDYKAKVSFVDDFRSAGVARPMKEMPEVELNYRIPLDELPRMWEQISMDIRNTIRHEIEHLMQSGPNVKKGKEMEPDRAERDEINKISKKPWWKIWRKALGTPDYYKLEKEIDANLEGLYLQAKKSRKPLEQVIDNYLKFTLNLNPEDRADIKALWKKRAPKLNIPLEEGRKKKKDPKKGTGKKPEGSKRRLYTDEDPKDTVGVKFSTRQDIVDTFGKKSFKSKSHARQSQVINLVHQRVRAAYNRAKDPKVKKRLKTALDYAEKRKEASKAKTQRLKKQKMNENQMSMDDFNLVGAVLRDKNKAEKIHKLLLQMFPQQKELLDYNYKNDSYAEFKRVIFHIDKYKIEGPKLIQHTKLKLDPEVYKERDRKYEEYAKGKIKKYFRDSDSDPRTLDLSKVPPITIDSTGEVADGNHRAFLAIKQQKPLRAYQIVDAKNDHPNVEKILNIVKSTTNINEDLEKIRTKYKIFSDMDGVITDFDNRFKKYSKGIAPSDYEKKYGKDKFWELADQPGIAFWVGMPWMEDGKNYWDYIKDYDVELLSSPSRSQVSRLGKRLWVRNNLPGIRLTLAQARNKQNYAAPNHILIDDRKSNIDQWISQGGIGILHTSASDTIKQLKKLGL